MRGWEVRCLQPERKDPDMRKNPEDIDVITFDILLERKFQVETGLEQLNKRAKRKKLPLLTWTWGKPGTKEVEHTGKRFAFIPLTLPIEMPKFKGWQFVAVLQHLGTENIVRAVSGSDADIPKKYRSAGPNCEHCQHDRRRADTYLLKHEDGRYAQVGSTCIEDFLGSNAALALAARAEFYAQTMALLEDEGWGAGGGGDRRSQVLVLTTFLAMVAAAIREFGWLSVKMAEERGGLSTGDVAWDAFFNIPKGQVKKEPTAADDATAEKAAAWAENLPDAEVDKPGMGSFLHNIRAIARSGLVEGRTRRMAAAIVASYSRAMGIEREKREVKPFLNEWLGKVGEKLTVIAKLDFLYRYETDYGVTTLLKFVTPEGANVAWRASSPLAGEDDIGKFFKVSGTVKGHDTYKERKQTFVTRAKLVEVPEGTALEILVPTEKKKRAKKAEVAKPNARRISITAEDRRFLEANVLDPFLANSDEPKLASLAMSIAESLASTPRSLLLDPREEKLLHEVIA